MGCGRLPDYRRDDRALRSFQHVAMDAHRADDRLGRTRPAITTSRCSPCRFRPGLGAWARIWFRRSGGYCGAIAGPLAALAVIGLLSSIVNAIDAYKIGFWFASVPG